MEVYHIGNSGARPIYFCVSWEHKASEGRSALHHRQTCRRIRRFQIGCDEALRRNTARPETVQFCRAVPRSRAVDELFGLVQPAESPEELTEQIHHVEIENAKLEATAAAQSAQIRSTHTMCYVLALFCMLLSFSLIACLATDSLQLHRCF